MYTTEELQEILNVFNDPIQWTYHDGADMFHLRSKKQGISRFYAETDQRRTQPLPVRSDMDDYRDVLLQDGQKSGARLVREWEKGRKWMVWDTGLYGDEKWCSVMYEQRVHTMVQFTNTMFEIDPAHTALKSESQTSGEFTFTRVAITPLAGFGICNTFSMRRGSGEEHVFNQISMKWPDESLAAMSEFPQSALEMVRLVESLNDRVPRRTPELGGILPNANVMLGSDDPANLWPLRFIAMAAPARLYGLLSDRQERVPRWPLYYACDDVEMRVFNQRAPWRCLAFLQHELPSAIGKWKLDHLRLFLDVWSFMAAENRAERQKKRQVYAGTTTSGATSAATDPFVVVDFSQWIREFSAEMTKVHDRLSTSGT